MAEMKKYLDTAALSTLVDQIKAEDKKVKDYADQGFGLAVAEAVGEATGLINDLAEGAVRANTEAIAAIKDDVNIDSFADVVTALGGKQEIGDYATKAEAQGYADAKDVAITEAKVAADAAQAALDLYKESNDEAVADLTTYVGTIPTDATATNVVAYVQERTSNIVTDAVLAELQQTVNDLSGIVSVNEQDIEEKVSNLDTAYKTADEAIRGEIANVLTEAREYADANDNDTKYGIVYDSESKTINLIANGTESQIDVSDFIRDGMLSSVTADEVNNTLTFAWNTDSGITTTTIALTSIADIYKGSTGDQVSIAVSNENIITATLSDSVKASLANANAALAKAQEAAGALDGYKEAHKSDYTNAQIDAAIQVNTDAIATLDDTYATDEELAAAIAEEIERANDAYVAKEAYDAKVAVLEEFDAGQEVRIAALEAKFGDGEGSVADLIRDAIEAAATDSSNKDAVVLSEAQKYTDQKDTAMGERVDVLAQAIADFVAITPDEVNELFNPAS